MKSYKFYFLGICIYLAFGFIFAIVFILMRIERLDPEAKTRSKGSCLLIIPGVAILAAAFHEDKMAENKTIEHNPYCNDE